MKERNFYYGMGMGLVLGGCAMYALRPRGTKSFVGRVVKTMGEVADAVTDMMGW